METAQDSEVKKGRPRRYQEVSKEKSDGATYTPPALAAFVARKMVEQFKYEKNEIRILDPAAGDGALLEALLAELPARELHKAKVVAYDTDPEAVKKLKERLVNRFGNIDLTIEITDFLEDVLDRRSTGLFSKEKLSFDLVISNPPYVRTQIIGADYAQSISSSFGLSGRVDLFQPFVLAISESLSDDGIAGIIVSNRVMTTKGCSSLRRGILTNFGVIHVWDLGDTKPFGAAVLPAVILATTPGASSTPLLTTIYETKEPANCENIDNLLDALSRSDGSIVCYGDGKKVKKFHVKAGKLDNSNDIEGVWRVATPSTDSWLENVASRTWGTFGTIGKIRVGIKTTADKVFIRNDWDTLGEAKPELLKPLITRQSARRFRPLNHNGSMRVLYTHESGPTGNKRAVDLDKYPASKEYLSRYRETLEGRDYVIKAGRNWWEIWVPQDPSAWAQPKLIFPDISDKPIFWMDDSGAVVNGDCYWIIPNTGADPDLIWLALAIGNSTFAEEFYDHKFNNKLYAGRRRFITQYVEEFPIPDPSLPISRVIARTAREIREMTPSPEAEILAAKLQDLVREVFGVSVEKV